MNCAPLIAASRRKRRSPIDETAGRRWRRSWGRRCEHDDQRRDARRIEDPRDQRRDADEHYGRDAAHHHREPEERRAPFLEILPSLDDDLGEAVLVQHVGERGDTQRDADEPESPGTRRYASAIWAVSPLTLMTTVWSRTRACRRSIRLRGRVPLLLQPFPHRLILLDALVPVSDVMSRGHDPSSVHLSRCPDHLSRSAMSLSQRRRLECGRSELGARAWPRGRWEPIMDASRSVRGESWCKASERACDTTVDTSIGF